MIVMPVIFVVADADRILDWLLMVDVDFAAAACAPAQFRIRPNQSDKASETISRLNCRPIEGWVRLMWVSLT